MNDWPFDPILFSIGPFQAHWYGLMYSIAFVACYLYLHHSKAGKALGLDSRTKDGFAIATILGILLGARLGYALFYNLNFYLEDPIKIFAVWEGGMASHGALLGSVIAAAIYTKVKKIKILPLSDLVLSIAPLGIILIRIGNFINAELYGRVAENFCIYFPTDPENCRYPSQLFQAFLEGFILLVIMQIIARKKPKPGITTAAFLIIYGIFRIIGELFREPDPQIGFLFSGITQGQLLSSIMVTVGIILYFRFNKARK